MICYVHGWHHTAKDKDNDVLRFRSALDLLARAETDVPLVGVYLGWDGEQLPYAPLIGSPFSYYPTKAAGERLGNGFDCVDALTQCALAAHRSDGRSILIGHSFGGLVLERTIKASLTNASETGQNVALENCLFVTLNSATESVLTRQTMQAFESRVCYNQSRGCFVNRVNGERVLRGDEPLAVSITSANDHSTGWLFPLASWVWQIAHPTRGWQEIPRFCGDGFDREGTYLRHTPGHHQGIRNLVAIDPQPITPGKPAYQMNLYHTQHDPNHMTFVTSSKGQKESEGASSEGAGEGPWQRWKLVNELNPRLPVWSVRVPKEIINDHGGIWSNNSVSMLAAIFRMKFPNDDFIPASKPLRAILRSPELQSQIELHLPPAAMKQ